MTQETTDIDSASASANGLEDDEVPTEEEEDEPEHSETARFGEAVVTGTDWTTETVVAQMRRGNIQLNPKFQRRDAWTRRQKSAFIESLILGLPVPQIVLAERRGEKGRYIVLDGKQRLLTLLQFTGNATNPPASINAFRLGRLTVRDDLRGVRFATLEKDPERRADLDAFYNQTIRTVVIRNWPNLAFLHVVFIRLNTGSVRLSPQELRQALFPGWFSDQVDDLAIESAALRKLLNRSKPDARMRDVEIMVRFLAFQNLLRAYHGRMKSFLDLACESFNADQEKYQNAIVGQCAQFEEAVAALLEIFGASALARKPGARSFNRAVFDALAFYAAEPVVRTAMLQHSAAVRQSYDDLWKASGRGSFADAAESDTAGLPNTVTRLSAWGLALGTAIGAPLPIPRLVSKQDPAEL